MRVLVGAASDIGQVREGNEDSYLVLDPLFAVADGMGGHRGGDVASTLALQTVERMFSAHDGSLIEQVEAANRAVFERSQSDRAVAGMGTTLTAALVQGGRVRLAHVGDSRAYLYRDGELLLLTEDHTLVHRMVEEGEITKEEAETHPHRNILTRALGTDDAVQVDEVPVDVRPGDRLLLCTDGLTGMVHEDEIRGVLQRTREPQAAVQQLVDLANRAGGIDNITAVILDIADDGPGDHEGAGAPTATVEATDRRAAPLATPGERPDARTVTRGPILEVPAPLRARTPRVLVLRALVIFVVFIAGMTALRFYIDSQWFVGVSNGRVAVFRGLPVEIGRLHLNSVVVETTIPAAEAESLAVYRNLPDGITADDRAAADAIVEQIRQDVARAQSGGP